MLNVTCTIRDYSPSADTCSVEIQGIGIVEAWLDGVAIAPTVSRGYLVYGAQGVLSLPDAHRLCEASLIQVIPPSALKTVQGTGAVQKTLSGRDQITTNSSGNGSVTITFSSPFSAAPTIAVLGDNLAAINVSAITTNGFTATLASPGTPNSYVLVSWSAGGTS